MLHLLSGTTHIVITGVALKPVAVPNQPELHVHFRGSHPTFSKSQAEQYITSGRWKGKAGGYGIQDPNPIVTCIAGSITNVIGLPMEQTRSLLEKAGVLPVP